MSLTTERRFARLSSDGSFNVSTEGEDIDAARKLLSASSDDDDTQLVQVEIAIINWLGRPKLEVVQVDEVEHLRHLLREALNSRAPDYVPGDWSDRVREALQDAE